MLEFCCPKISKKLPSTFCIWVHVSFTTQAIFISKYKTASFNYLYGIWIVSFNQMMLFLSDNVMYECITSLLFCRTASRHPGQRFSITPYISPRLTPTGTPKIISTSVSPRGFSAVGSTQKTSGMTSPTKPHERRTTLSSWYPASQQSSAANSPPCGRSLPGILKYSWSFAIYLAICSSY